MANATFTYHLVLRSVYVRCRTHGSAGTSGPWQSSSTLHTEVGEFDWKPFQCIDAGLGVNVTPGFLAAQTTKPPGRKVSAKVLTELV